MINHFRNNYKAEPNISGHTENDLTKVLDMEFNKGIVMPLNK